jgi:EAL domain-containing protein (putative c-di-GMP-specific phosphodiesterase class I)
VLHYQPKVDVRGARMVGAEALMRWRRNGVLVPPGDFIPLAEETGLIVPMSEWAIREAARQARIWQDSFGFADSIAVNLPNRMFERTDLVEYIHNAVTTYGVPHHAIELEITETGLMKDLQNVIPSLHRLNEIGVEISIDDFGTGYSSLAYLTTLPISELKIDRSFVRDLGMTPQSSAVVTAIIALARSLGLRVIAEGVENLRQMEVLHRLGCGVMQGFLFSKPQPPETSTWLQQTVLPRKAPWIGKAGEADAPRCCARRADPRAKPAEMTGHAMEATLFSRADGPGPRRRRRPPQLAKAALRRLVLDKLEPTPENYARAYRQEAGERAARSLSATERGRRRARRLIERIVRGIERGGRNWTAARKKESLQRVLVRQPQRREAAAAAPRRSWWQLGTRTPTPWSPAGADDSAT